MLPSDILALYRVRNVTGFCRVFVRLLKENIPHHLFLIWFSPGFDTREMFVNPPTFINRTTAQKYLKKNIRHDLWMKNSPKHPRIHVVRHSDYTDPELLKESIYYRTVLKPVGSLYGVSLVAWHKKQWVANLTIHRSATQGDFSNADLRYLRRVQPHFSAVIRRFCDQQDSETQAECLKLFASKFSTPFVLFNWSLSPLFYNIAARWKFHEIVAQDQGTKLEPNRRFYTPPEIEKQIRGFRDKLSDLNKPTKPTNHNFILNRGQGVQYRIHYVPSRKGSITAGLFLLDIEEARAHSYSLKPSLLSQSELAVYQYLKQGLTNKEIGVRLKKSAGTAKNQVAAIFSKLGIVGGRSELLSRS